MKNKSRESLEEKLYRENLGIIISQAIKYPPTSICDIDDYIQIGSLALLESIWKFKPSRNTKWSTFATTCVGRAIYKEYLRTKFTLRMPVESGKVSYKLMLDEHTHYSDEELAKHFGIKVNTLRGIKSLLTSERLPLDIPSLFFESNFDSFLEEISGNILSQEEKSLVKAWIEGSSYKEIAKKVKKNKKFVAESIKTSLEKLKKEYEEKNSVGE